MLGLTPQSDKVGKATFEAAWYAKAAFIATIVSVILAITSISVTTLLA